MAKNYREELLKLANGNIDKKFERFIKALIFKEALKFEQVLRKKYGDDYVEELYSDFVEKVLRSKGLIQNSDHISTGYIRTIIRNLLVDKINGSYQYKHYSLSESVFTSDDGKEVSFEEILKEEKVPAVVSEMQNLIKAIKEDLEDRDLLVLCYYVHYYLYGEKREMRGLSKANLYKRWERLKPYMRKLFDGLREEEVRAFMEIYLSEVCDGLGL